MHFRADMVSVWLAAMAVAMAFCDGASAGKTYVVREERDRVRDLETSASGYIYRTDGENPPLFIKLGEGKNEKFDAILENFKKENGFHGKMPTISNEPASPYHIPVVGHEKNVVHYNSGRSGGGGLFRPNTHLADDPMSVDDFDDEEKYGDGKYSDANGDVAPIMDFNNDHHFDNDFNDDGGFDFGLSSPFKYHHDVSADGLKGDSFGFNNDQNYYGSPYTHNEYTSPGKHHSKAGGSFQKAGHYFSHGSQGDKGYNKHNDFDKGHAGHYGKDDLKSHYKKASGHSAGHADEGDHYGKHHSNTHGAKGQKYGETASHKKGHKTKGFHNVYHKDEYNKEQKFYDDAHKHGKHEKYGGKHKDFGHKAGSNTHGSHHDSGYDEAHKGAVGHHAKGGYHDAHKGHSGESGHESHHDHKAGYDQLSDNKKYGEHESGGGGGGAGDDFY